METNRRHRVIIILGLILLPLVAGIISLIIKIALFLAIVAGLYWAYLTFIKKMMSPEPAMRRLFDSFDRPQKY